MRKLAIFSGLTELFASFETFTPAVLRKPNNVPFFKASSSSVKPPRCFPPINILQISNENRLNVGIRIYLT